MFCILLKLWFFLYFADVGLPLRTLAARKAFDEPLDVSIKRKELEERTSPQTCYPEPEEEEEQPINLEVPKDQNQVFNNGELTVVRRAVRAPSPPQDEPMDFSTKKNTEVHTPALYTSSKEMRFAKNLKHVLVEIMRRHPGKARVILGYLRFAWKKVKMVQTAAATGQTPSHVQVSGGQSNSAGSGQRPSGSSGSSSGSSGSSSGGGSSGSGGGNGGGGGYYGGSGGLGGSGCAGGSGNGNNDRDGHNNNRRNINNNNKGSLLDLDLDFEELPQNSNTAKWFQEHPDINAGKILDGLLSLKTEYPDDGPNGAHPVEKPTQMGPLDHTTANLLQMSVPDPSATFLDIGTEIGGTSLYEDDPFNLDHLLPSNFNINQLDVLPSSPDHHSHFQNNNNQLTAHGAEASMAITSKTIMENNNHNGPMPLHSGSNPMGLYPETTISPMSGPSGSHMQPMALKSVIKQEPLAYIKREDNNNQHLIQQLHPPPPHMLHDGGYLHGTPGASPISSLSSPGSPPNNRPGLYGLPVPHPQPHVGGGKIRTPVASTSSASSRKKSANEPTPEEEELASIPSLQMRVKVLQQRVIILVPTFTI